MKTYTVSLKYEAWANMTIEATSEEEAKQKAWQALESTEMDTSYGEWTDADVEEIEEA